MGRFSGEEPRLYVIQVKFKLQGNYELKMPDAVFNSSLILHCLVMQGHT